MEPDLRIGSVVIDCNDFPAMSRFWQEALRYIPREEPEDDWVVLKDPEGRNVQVSIHVVPEPRVGKNRLHFDLYTSDQTARSNGCWRSAPRASRARRSRARTSSCWRTPRATSSA